MDAVYDELDFTDTNAWSKSFEWMGYRNCNFLEQLNTSWLYYGLMVFQGLVMVFSHYSGCRTVVVEEMIPEFMGWFVSMTDLELFTGLTMILLIETFYEMFLNSIMGLEVFIDYPAISLNLFDWFSISCNLLFVLFIVVFLMTTLWFTKTVRDQK